MCNLEKNVNIYLHDITFVLYFYISKRLKGFPGSGEHAKTTNIVDTPLNPLDKINNVLLS